MAKTGHLIVEIFVVVSSMGYIYVTLIND